MSFGSSNAGMPSFVSAISKAYRPGKINRVKVETRKRFLGCFFQSSDGHACIVVCVQTWKEMTHQLVILINMIF